MKNTVLLVGALALGTLSACQYGGVEVSASGCLLQPQAEVVATAGCNMSVRGSGVGYALDGWIERNCRNGHIRILAGGHSTILQWFKGVKGLTAPAPAYIADCEVAIAGPELFNQDFESYYDVETTDERGTHTDLAAMGLAYSDVVLPAWRAARLKQ